MKPITVNNTRGHSITLIESHSDLYKRDELHLVMGEEGDYTYFCLEDAATINMLWLMLNTAEKRINKTK